jgi:hypothetical protein
MTAMDNGELTIDNGGGELRISRWAKLEAELEAERDAYLGVLCKTGCPIEFGCECQGKNRDLCLGCSSDFKQCWLAWAASKREAANETAFDAPQTELQSADAPQRYGGA